MNTGLPAGTFILRGEEYKLSKAEVEQAAVNLLPRPSEKYVIEIKGRRYPPKQLLAESLRLPPATFTTFDACRILKKIGFVILLASELPTRTSPDSEEIRQRLDTIDRRFDDLTKMLQLENRIAALEREFEKIKGVKL